MYGHCVLRIRDTDFDPFCGFGKKDHNVTINEYIEVYVNNDNFNAFQIESSGELDLKKIAYISEKIRWANPFFLICSPKQTLILTELLKDIGYAFIN